MRRSVSTGQPPAPWPKLDDASREELAGFFAEHEPLVRRCCKRVLGADPAAVDDAVSETFLRAARHVRRLQEHPRWVTLAWLAKAARHAALAQTDYGPRKVKQILTGEDIEAASPVSDVDNTVGIWGLEYWLRRAAETFGPENQQLIPLALQYKSGLISMAAVAAELKISHATAKMRVFRMTEKPNYLLRALLTAYLAETRGQSCDTARDIVDGRPLTPLLRADVTGHAQTCPTCRETREKLPRLLGITSIFAFLTPPRPHGQDLRDIDYSQDLPSAEAGSTDPQQPTAVHRELPAGITCRRAWLAASLAAVLALGLAFLSTYPRQLSQALTLTTTHVTARTLTHGKVSRPDSPATPVQSPPDPAVSVPGEHAVTSSTTNGGMPPSGGKPGTQTPPSPVAIPQPTPTPAPTTPAVPPPTTATVPPPGEGPPPGGGEVPLAVPDVWLTVSSAHLTPGDVATIQAHLSSSLTGTPYVVLIVDQTVGRTVQECSSGSTCQLLIDFAVPAAHSYTAEVDDVEDDTTVAGPTIPVTVTWSIPPPPTTPPIH